MFNFFLNVIDNPTNDFSGSSAQVEIGKGFFNAPNFFLGFFVGIICCIVVKYIYDSLKKQNPTNDPDNTNNDNQKSE